MNCFCVKIDTLPERAFDLLAAWTLRARSGYPNASTIHFLWVV